MGSVVNSLLEEIHLVKEIQSLPWQNIMKYKSRGEASHCGRALGREQN